ncbi:MAG: hypothetical protein WDZ31_07505, partial [Phycisphaeraceae bacterium]
RGRRSAPQPGEPRVGWREKLNQHGGLVTLGAVAVAGIAVLVVWLTLFGGPAAEPAQAYFTSDDGQTYFTGAYHRFPPFEHEGGEAVRAYLFTCDGGENQFVGYLQKYTPEARQALEAAEASESRTFTDVLEELPLRAMLVKRPGDGRWVPRGTPEAERVRRVGCPDGSRARVVLIR